uniref:Uncharacterized protein n=3 Tax=Aegilops tauschii subsp. strangulata TaxID=200361 RepID=A0A453FSH3_AEGTS
KCPPTTARSHPLKLTLSFPSHPPGHPSLAPLQIPVVAGLSSPSSPLSHPASSLSPHHRATPFPPTARNPPPIGQKLDFLGAGDELLAGGGVGSACFDAGDEATWIRAGCCWRGLRAVGGPGAAHPRGAGQLPGGHHRAAGRRELIQNADDAGASCVRLCLDRRAHGSRSLLAPALAQCTPATTPPSPTKSSPASPASAAARSPPRPGRPAARWALATLSIAAELCFELLLFQFELR